MGPLSRSFLARMGLRPLHDVDMKRRITITMTDGVALKATLFEPVGLTTSPTVLIRSPYGRAIFGYMMARPLASQGYRVLVQSTRGTADSEGTFAPFHDEHDDGLATVKWIEQQDWFDGRIATFGPSYLGYVQWAIGTSAGDVLRAQAVQVSTSDFSRITYTGDTMQLELSGVWTQLMSHLERRRGILTMLRHQITGKSSIADDDWLTLPISNLDKTITGHEVPYWKDWTTHASSNDEFWRRLSFTETIPDIDHPIHLVSGWHDIVAPWTVQDFAELQAAGAPTRITIGPWWHNHPDLLTTSMREAAELFAVQFKGAPPTNRPPVRLFVKKAKTWRNYESFPPPEAVDTRWFLQVDGRLGHQPGSSSSSTSFRYDPADPTPSIGGPSLISADYEVDNTDHESREDVITYTSPVLDDDIDVIGFPTATIWFQSSASSADVFVRLCDVSQNGRSFNVCDGIQRVDFEAGSEPKPVTVRLWPTAYRFRAGHRLRVQISSGAFPRFARNLGTGEPIGSGIDMVVADQAVHHSPTEASSVTLPVVS